MENNIDKTPEEVLEQYYKENHFDSDGGNSKPYVRVEIARWFVIYIPNSDARRKVVLKHDIHHLLTGYKTDFSGESEISAWEIASGCTNYMVAFLINSGGVMMGLFTNFSGVLRAFARGRKTKNLYHNEFTDQQALKMKIGELQKQFRLDEFSKENTHITFTDFCIFFLFILYGIIYSVMSLLIIPFIILYSIYIYLTIPSKKRIQQ